MSKNLSQNLIFFFKYIFIYKSIYPLCTVCYTATGNPALFFVVCYTATRKMLHAVVILSSFQFYFQTSLILQWFIKGLPQRHIVRHIQGLNSIA